VRAGNGPRLLRCATYRITGHTSTDAAAWRPSTEVEAAKARDPIAMLAHRLKERGLAPNLIDQVALDAQAEMATARQAARDAPWPSSATAFEDVQDTGAVAAPKTRRRA
jgi:pyruvate dehydrogenase E1 component alpha subunit